MTAEEAFRLLAAAPLGQKWAVGSLVWESFAAADDLEEAKRYLALLSARNNELAELLGDD